MLNYRENCTSLLLNQNTQINLEKFKQETITAYFLPRNINHPILGLKDGLLIYQWIQKTERKLLAQTQIRKYRKLKECQFKFIHRIVVTKKELFRYGIHTDSDCTYCSEPDSIDHTFINCTFTRTFARDVIDWFNVQNGSSFQPDTKEILFSSCKYPNNPVLERKVNYTLLFMKYYIYASKLNNSLLCLTDFSNKLNLKYKVENLTH